MNKIGASLLNAIVGECMNEDYLDWNASSVEKIEESQRSLNDKDDN